MSEKIPVPVIYGDGYWIFRKFSASNNRRERDRFKIMGNVAAQRLYIGPVRFAERMEHRDAETVLVPPSQNGKPAHSM